LLHGLNVDSGIACRVSVAEQKRTVADDTVTYLAKSREINEEPLLEQRGNGVVEVGRHCKSPEPLDDLWSVRFGDEEIGN
jgi:hypothetical protein